MDTDKDKEHPLSMIKVELADGPVIIWAERLPTPKEKEQLLKVMSKELPEAWCDIVNKKNLNLIEEWGPLTTPEVIQKHPSEALKFIKSQHRDIVELSRLAEALLVFADKATEPPLFITNGVVIAQKYMDTIKKFNLI